MDNIIRATSVSGSRRLRYDNESTISGKLKDVHREQVKQPALLQSDEFSAGEQPTLISESYGMVDAQLQEASDLHRMIEASQQKILALEQENDLLRQKLEAATNPETLEALAKEGYEGGYRKGFDAAQLDAKEQIDAALKGFEDLLIHIAQQSEQAWERVHEEVSNLSFAVVCKLLGERAADQSATIAIVDQVIATIRDQVELKVLLSPKDYRLLTASNSDLRILSGRKVELREDPRVGLGGCLVETDLGAWDGRLEHQLRHLKHAVDLAAKQVQE